MKRTKLIGDAFHSVVPAETAGVWSQGYSGHTDNSSFFAYEDFEITAIRSITDQVVPGSSTVVTNDVYIDYSYLSGTTISGTTSIYSY
jgi:hypothetical protein